MAFVTKGSIICQANGTTYRLTEGTGIFFNTNVLHAYMQDDDNGCLYKAILCDISLLFGPPGSLIYERYIAPFLSDTTRSSILLDSSSSWQRELIDTAVSMADKDLQQAPFLELSLLEGITKIWRLLCEHTGSERPASSRSVRDITRMKAAMAYIQEHCGGSISLAELASVCSLSQSEMLPPVPTDPSPESQRICDLLPDQQKPWAVGRGASLHDRDCRPVRLPEQRLLFRNL